MLYFNLFFFLLFSLLSTGESLDLNVYQLRIHALGGAIVTQRGIECKRSKEGNIHTHTNIYIHIYIYIIVFIEVNIIVVESFLNSLNKKPTSCVDDLICTFCVFVFNIQLEEVKVMEGHGACNPTHTHDYSSFLYLFY